MSNVETVRRILHALEHNDVESFVRELAEDVRWELHPTGNTAQEADVPYMRIREGREAAAGFLLDIDEDFEMHALELKSFLEGVGAVGVLIAYELTVRATGKRVRDEEIQLYTFDSDGRVATFRHFLDTARAIEAHS